VTFRGTIASAVPGADPLTGLSVRLARLPTPVTPVVLDRARVDSRGRFTLRARVNRSGTLFLTTPRFRNLSPLSLRLGRFTVRNATARSVDRAGRRFVAAR
jgi:hypothetical protein